MRPYNLGFISDEAIYAHVKETVCSYRREITCFYKGIFGLADDNWTYNESTGEIENLKLGIYAKLNLYKTNIRKAYILMQEKLLSGNFTTCFLVDMTYGNSNNNILEVECDGEHFSNKHISAISFNNFFNLVFGEGSFEKLCNSTHEILEDVFKDYNDDGKF